jgi:5-formyltetrahydrofolate cyclo-ligase
LVNDAVAIPPSGAEKKEWRAYLRATAKPVDAPTTAALVANVVKLVKGIPGLILFYRSMPGEAALEDAADELGWQRFATTRTPDEGPLTIHPAIGAMEQHRYGFAQPVDDAMDLPPHHISATLVPGMAFDQTGVRLGHGRGYYDELLSRIPSDRPRIGITVDRLLFDALPSEPHDIPMTHIVTESRIIELDQRHSLTHREVRSR